jgi:hypothetical protein
MRKYWIFAVLLSFILGIAVEKVLEGRWPSPTAPLTAGGCQ